MTGIRRLALADAPRVRPGGGRTIYAVSDVHGRYDLLTTLLEAVVADIAATSPAAAPLLVFCGGHIDRGPASADVLTALVWLTRRAPVEACVLRGANEAALLDFIDNPETLPAWLALGGEATLRAYGVAPPVDRATPAEIRDALADRLPASHLAILRAARVTVVCGDCTFAHASDTRAAGVLVHGDGDGDDRPRIGRNRIGIDTGAQTSGILTALRLSRDAVEILQTGGGDDHAPPPAPAEAAPGTAATTMRDALAQLRPGYGA